MARAVLLGCLLLLFSCISAGSAQQSPYDDPQSPWFPEGAIICFNDTSASKEIKCNNNITYVEEERDELYSAQFFVDLIVVLALVLFAGLMSGLTLGLLSMDPLNLEVLISSGTAIQKKYARRIMPLVSRHHLLLVTLLLSNAAAMEALPIFLEKMVAQWLAIIVSVTLVLFFGEVIPQAVCTRYGLAIGAHLFWLVWALIVITFPVSFPISKLLDCIIGTDHSHLFRRNELKALVSIHQMKQGQTEGLDEDEVRIVQGALELKEKKVEDAMVSLEDVYMLDFNSLLDKNVIKTILKEGHSRIPVYKASRSHIIGLLHVKTILSKAANTPEPVPIRKLDLRPLPSVTSQKPLFAMLNLFKSGKSHMAMVLDENDSMTVQGIITLEDIVEALLQTEIYDESDVERLRSKETENSQGTRPSSEIQIGKVYSHERKPLLAEDKFGYSV